jgi:hypothetical protein
VSATDADGKPLPTPLPPALQPLHRKHRGTGQRVSKERGAHTRKKNPGKRARQGGS